MSATDRPCTTSHQLARAITEDVKHRLEEAAASVLPDLRLPGVFAGHRIDAAANAAFLSTSTRLLELGVRDVAGIDLRDASLTALDDIDPDATEGFGSFFVGDAVLRLGGLDAVSDPDAVLRAVRSPRTTEQVRAGALPANWIVVATRCLAAEAQLSGTEPPDLAELVQRTTAMFRSSPTGWINDGMGGGAHFDAYTADVYLFAEPLAAWLGPAWADGFRDVLADLDDLVHPGGAIVWGRSIGALGLALTPELAGVAVRHDVSDHVDVWLERARQAARRLDRWLPGGVIAADQHRTGDFYRGPGRRLEMTLDVMSKLLTSAIDMLAGPAVALADPTAVWSPTDRLFRFDERSTAGVWSYRSDRGRLSFALPIQKGWTTDYLPSLRSPGLFDCPTNGHACFLPTVFMNRPDVATPLVPDGLASSIEHRAGGFEIRHEGWGPPSQMASIDDPPRGRRRAVYRVDGRTIRVEEELEIDDVESVSSVSLLVPELADRPLDVAVTGAGATIVTIDTSGLAEWRSYWSEIARVHQIEVPVADRMDFHWEVRPQLRVGSTIHGTTYDRSLYRALRSRVRAGPAPSARADDLAEQLLGLEVLHLGWPEWWTGTDPDETAAVIDTVEASGVTVVWTQHNLAPHHDKSDDARSCYELWARAAHRVIHHSEWGQDLARSTYDFRPDASHAVIPHGHWGAAYERHASGWLGPNDRSVVEQALGWEPCAIRLAVTGSPRTERDLQLVLDAFHGSKRDDLQLVIRLAGDEQVPDDPRIIVDRGPLDPQMYFWRAGAIDALVLPITRPGMLTTGSAFDAIGGGMAAITSDWGYFDETFDGTDIRFGTTADDLRRCLDSLTPEEVARCRRAVIALRPRYDWQAISHRTLELLQSLVDVERMRRPREGRSSRQ